jgi:hypothetical protein
MSLIYEIRIRGRLSPTLLAQFEQPDMVADVGPTETVLHGAFADQAALFGLLRRVEALGLELLALRRMNVHGTPARH